MEEMQRTPCPERILEDTGGAFLIGSIGSSILYTLKGIRNLPVGHKMRGISSMIRMRSPTVAGNFAMWGLAFSSVECTLVGIRKKEDPFNSIMAGGVAGGVLTIHKGAKAIRNSAFFGFLILALIEGVSYQLNKSMQKQMENSMRHMDSLQEMNNRLYGIQNNPQNKGTPPTAPTGRLSELDIDTLATTELEDPRINSFNNQLKKKFNIFS